MTLSRETAQTALGFLAVVGHPGRGLFGGYLLLGATGRPLEFHCTAGVQASRAQEILFGPTLKDYLYGELIGQTLYEKASLQPLVVCTNDRAALALREFVPVPVAHVAAEDSGDIGRGSEVGARDAFHRVDAAHSGVPRTVTFRCGRNRLAVDAAYSGDQQEINERLALTAESFDLAEPFSRIQAAIEEAQRGAQ